jgi:hypothetical protein
MMAPPDDDCKCKCVWACEREIVENDDWASAHAVSWRGPSCASLPAGLGARHAVSPAARTMGWRRRRDPSASGASREERSERTPTRVS